MNENQKDIYQSILDFHKKNRQLEPSIISQDEINILVSLLLNSISKGIDGDIVELGCFVGESSKYFRYALDQLKSQKKLYVYDSFEGLPELSKWELDSGWKAGTLKTSEQILVANFIQNNLEPPIIHKNWFKDIPEDALPESICFAFLDGDFYESIYSSLEKIYDKVTPHGYICIHDYDRPDLPGVKAAVEDFCKNKNIPFNVIKLCDNLSYLRKPAEPMIDPNLTIVSGLWDINRVSREWDTYMEHFEKFLKIPCNMFLWIPKSLEPFVWARRLKSNTFVRSYDLSDIKNSMFSPFWHKWQSIRNQPEWQNQAGWLSQSPQCKNEYYNPIVMSKMFFLHDAKILNPFNTDYLIWLDAGITQTVGENYFYNRNNLDKITKNLDPFLFLSYPYESDTEIHGFEINAINKYAGSKVEYVCRGGLFGGHKDFLSQANREYYHLLEKTLNEGFAGTEESIFAILAKLHPDRYKRYELDGNGLIVKFMQSINDNNVTLAPVKKNDNKFTPSTIHISDIKTSLYFLTFNFPEQLEATIKSLEKHEGFLNHPVKKIIIDNSTNESARQGNRTIAHQYNFEYIPMNKNIGICGGRQFAADHFDSSDSDFYLFFEDDMTISDQTEGVCRNGFQKYIPKLYDKIHRIMLKEKFDFLKLSFTEVYMDNNLQVSWYNVPQTYRTETWPNYDKLPITGLDPHCPRTNFKNIEVLDGLSYISGEIYYANWPHITSRSGNKKMFINTKWAHPYEQTWMSHIFQETRKGNIHPGVLLASTVTHDRFKHYRAEERIEG